MPSSVSRIRAGFTLVELSIVLVIIGLLLGGVIIGKEMIRSAQLRSVITDVQGYLAASMMFQDKYQCLPGDCANATTFMSGVTNGNGNGQLDGPAGANAAGEIFGIWQHLTAARYIKGSFSGKAGPGLAWDAVIGVNVPASKIPNTGYSWNYEGVINGNSVMYNGSYRHVIYLGTEAGLGLTAGMFLTPAEAYAIDVKMDDGNPATGNTVTLSMNSNATTNALPNTCSTGANSAGASAAYNISGTAVACSLVFISGW